MAVEVRSISPISVPTSQGWDNDGSGSWSSFAVQVGSPSQMVDVLISTASDTTWVVIPEGCPDTAPSNCDTSRGGLFEISNSSSWSDIGLFELDLQLNLDYTGNGDFGFDDVGLGYPGGGGPSLSHQVVAGIAATDFWLGSFGLDPEPSNFTNFADPQPSFLRSLYNSSMIPSLSWGYTAGAVYRYDKVQGSLTLGGYDQSRFVSNNITFNMYPDVARRFIVSLISASFYKTVVTPESTAAMFIDSTVPFLYLPLDMCKAFETAFGLTWNATSQLYTIDDPAATKDTNITLQIANQTDSRVNITIPFAAFNLTANYPLSDNSVAYFPLRQAENDTQYTLGRVFLQEAYLTADYQRQQFSVSQAQWPVPSEEDIHAILPPSTSIPSSNTTTSPEPKKRKGKLGIIVGTVLGGVVVLAVVAISIWYVCFRSKRSNEEISSVSADSRLQTQDKPELDANDTTRNELEADECTARVPELQGEYKTELDANDTMKNELEAGEVGSWNGEWRELDSSYGLPSPDIAEMAAREPVGTEMLA